MELSRSSRTGGVITWLRPAGSTGRPRPDGRRPGARGRPGKRLARCGRGQALVEFALIVPVVLLLFMGIFELSSYFYARLTLRHSVLEASRFAITGSQMEDEESGDTLSRAASIARAFQRAAPTVPVDLESLLIDPPDGGQPGEIVTISATYRYEFFLPLVDQFFPSGVEFTVKTAMRNEPSFQ